MEALFEYSRESIDLLQAEDLIHQKNALLKKIEHQLMLLGKESAKNNAELAAISPLLKVSKGEKHEGLPFLVLDYPRIFGRQDVFAIRCLVWWGKQISVSLLLKGKYLKESISEISETLQKKEYQNFYVETKGSPWRHELSENNKNPQLPLNSEVDFLKISCKLPITALNELGSFYKKSFDKLLKISSHGED